MLIAVMRTVLLAAVPLTAVLGLGCGSYYGGHCGVSGSGVSEADDYSDGIAEIQLRHIERSVGGRTEKLAFDEPLHSGDKTALVISVPEPLYVYVVNLAPDGTKNIIWPHAEPVHVVGIQRIPEDGGWFTLTGETGQEVVALVGTRDVQSLTGDGRDRVLSLVERTASRSDLVLVQSALPPGMTDTHATMGVRGRSLSVVGKRVLASSLDPVVMLLDFDHRPIE